MRIVLALLAVLILGAPLAHADVGGEVPAPGLCEYPFIGASMMIGAGPVANVYTYTCDGPTEVNGSHWHAELGGEAVQAAVQAGITMMFFSANVSAAGNLGAIGGSTSWRCPDNTLAEAPNPPGAWKNHLNPTKCKSVGAAPPPPGTPPSEPPAEVGAAQNAINNPVAPAVTDPVNPNPGANQNNPRQ